jgi:hypothetical protein
MKKSSDRDCTENAGPLCLSLRGAIGDVAIQKGEAREDLSLKSGSPHRFAARDDVLRCSIYSGIWVGSAEKHFAGQIKLLLVYPSGA